VVVQVGVGATYTVAGAGFVVVVLGWVVVVVDELEDEELFDWAAAVAAAFSDEVTAPEGFAELSELGS